MKTVKIQELTLERFSKYGSFSEMLSPEGQKFGKNPIEFYRDMGVVTLPEDTVGISVTKVYKRSLIIKKAEFHDKCGEALVPLNGDVLIHVAPAGGRTVVPYDDFEVFFVPKGTLVILRPGVWHHAPFCIDDETVSILVVLPERTYAKDCSAVEFQEDNYIEIKE